MAVTITEDWIRERVQLKHNNLGLYNYNLWYVTDKYSGNVCAYTVSGKAMGSIEIGRKIPMCIGKNLLTAAKFSIYHDRVYLSKEFLFCY